MKRLIEWLLDCKHENCGWPITRQGVTYRTCLQCGRERKYDTARMRFVEFGLGEERKLRAPNYGAGVIL